MVSEGWLRRSLNLRAGVTPTVQFWQKGPCLGFPVPWSHLSPNYYLVGMGIDSKRSPIAWQQSHIWPVNLTRDRLPHNPAASYQIGFDTESTAAQYHPLRDIGVLAEPIGSIQAELVVQRDGPPAHFGVSVLSHVPPDMFDSLVKSLCRSN